MFTMALWKNTFKSVVKFSQKKFLSLPPSQQQRHLAEAVRQALTDGNFSCYIELLDHLGVQPPAKQWDDCYHIHLQLSGRRLKEHNLLRNSNQTDRKEPLAPPLPVTIYLDNLRSAHNVGSIVRTVEAFGLGPIIAGGTTPAPSKKTAMGCEQWVDFSCGTLEQTPSPLIALEINADALPYHSITLPKAFTLAVGNEERGCSQEVLNQADQVVYIPLRGRKNSLNVANAFAIFAARIALTS